MTAHPIKNWIRRNGEFLNDLKPFIEVIGIILVIIALFFNLVLIKQGKISIDQTALALQQGREALELDSKNFMYEKRPVLEITDAKWGGDNGKSVYGTNAVYSIILGFKNSSGTTARNSIGSWRIFVNDTLIHHTEDFPFARLSSGDKSAHLVFLTEKNYNQVRALTNRVRMSCVVLYSGLLEDETCSFSTACNVIREPKDVNRFWIEGLRFGGIDTDDKKRIQGNALSAYNRYQTDK